MRPSSPERAPGWRSRFGVPGWLILTFWIFFGVVVGNQIILSMPTHGHSWWKMVGWQVGAAMGWAALTPLVLWAGRRFPLQPRLGPVLGHLGASLAISAIQVIPTTLLALPIDPYTPVAQAKPPFAEYLFQLDNWLLLNVLMYFGIVALGTGVETKRRQVREARLRAELAQAELRALRLELQPHFIFNSLNAAAVLIRQGAVEDAERMLIQLSELLRRTLDTTGRQIVTVNEEIRLAEVYLDIQQVRFGDRLAVRLDVDADAASCPVPNLLLQPIVENAVRHGIGRREEGGTITISARRAGDRLTLRVHDDGPGLSATWSDDSIGYGLKNVSSRLEALYGNGWELDLFAEPEGGTVVEITIPARPAVAPVSDPAPAPAPNGRLSPASERPATVQSATVPPTTVPPSQLKPLPRAP